MHCYVRNPCIFSLLAFFYRRSIEQQKEIKEKRKADFDQQTENRKAAVKQKQENEVFQSYYTFETFIVLTQIYSSAC